MDARGIALILFVAVSAHAQSAKCLATAPASAAAQLQFFDEPNFIIAGVTDNTYRGGHGSDTILRSSEALANATASLGRSPAADEQSRDPLRAVQELQRAAQSNPTESNIFDWGTELLAHRAPDAAAEVFTTGIRHFPQSVRMLLGLASARYAAGSYASAANCFFEAADLAPADPTAYLFLGKVQAREILESSGYQERMARFAKLQPANALANYYYAVTVWSRRRESEDSEAATKARDLLLKAITLNPHLGLAYLQLGIIDADQRKYFDAIHAYNQAIDATPALEEPHYRLAEAYRVIGERPRAEQELALYNRLSKQSAERLEQERREVQQFVIALRNQKPGSQANPH